MGENEDDRLFVERGSSDCMPISVNSCGVSARTQSTDCHLLTSENEGRKCVSAFTSTVSGSIENEFIDVGKTRDVSTQAKDARLLDIEPVNGLKKSVRIDEVNKTRGTREAVNSSDSSSCRYQNSFCENSAEIRKFRFHCITPRPFVASSVKRESAPLNTVIPNTNGCGAVCQTNNQPLFKTDKTVLHFQDPSTDVNPLINDKTPDVIQTHITPGPLYESAVLVESRNSTGTAHEEVQVEGSGTNNKPHAEQNVVNSTHQQTSTGVVNVKSSIRTISDEGGLKPSVTDGLPEYNSPQIGDFQNSLKQDGRINGVSDSPSDMGNNNTSSRRSPSHEEDFNETSSKSKQPQSTPFANPEVSADSEQESSRTVTIPELIVSDSSMEQDLSALAIDKDKDQKRIEGPETAETDSSQPVKPQLRPYRSSDSAYSSDSRCTSMDSTTYQGGRSEDGEFCCDQETPAVLLSPPVISVDTKSVSSSSSSSSSPSHVQMGTSVNSTDSLRVISEYGLQRKLSSSSGSSFRSSLSLESEDDMLSSDGEAAREHFIGKGLRKQSKAQSSWAKIRRVVWSPFMQSFKKRYPWVQLAGHAGNFQPGEEGCILKKYCQREAECLSMLCHDIHLRPYAPEYHGIVDKDGERYTRMQDLLLAFDCPSVMDCKMGVRTYLEDELVKAKIKPRLRQDMYTKMTEISPNEPTPEEHAAKAVTKPRYMQWREHVSSSSNLGFRIEGIKKGGKDPSKDYKLTKTKEQVKSAFKYFIDEKSDVLGKYIKRLKDIRAAAEKSDFFMSHEVIGSSLLFVHDNTGIASAWMIDFGKTTQLPDNNRLTHREEWVEGNREDGYLFGLDNLIDIFEEILLDLTTGTVDDSGAMKSSNATNETSTCQTPVISFPPPLSSQSSGESVDLTPKNQPIVSITESPKKPILKRQVAATDSHDNISPQPNGAIVTPHEKEAAKNDGKDTAISNFDKT